MRRKTFVEESATADDFVRRLDSVDSISVLVADDEALVRHALRLFIDNAASLTVVGEARDGAEALKKTAALMPDVVLMDIQMPVMNGIEATAAIVEANPGVKVLSVTTFSTERHVVSALRAGASGYLVKDTTPDQIVQAIHDVHEGSSALSPVVTRELIDAVRRPGAPQHPTETSLDESLTDRELAAVKLLAEGLSNAEIGARLHVSEATVKSHLSRVMQKWGVRDRVQVLLHAVRAGIVTV